FVHVRIGRIVQCVASSVDSVRRSGRDRRASLMVDAEHPEHVAVALVVDAHCRPGAEDHRFDHPSVTIYFAPKAEADFAAIIGYLAEWPTLARRKKPSGA